MEEDSFGKTETPEFNILYHGRKLMDQGGRGAMGGESKTVANLKF